MNESTNKITIDKNFYESFDNRKWGFTKFSEKINGRVAMIAFIILYLIEFATKKNLLELIKFH